MNLPSNETLLWASILITSVLGISLSLLAVSFLRLIRKEDALQKDYELLKKKLHFQTSKMIESSLKDSFDILNESKNKAKEIIASANYFNENAKDEFGTFFEQIKQVEQQNYRDLSKNILEEFKKTLILVSNSASGVFDSEIKDFRASINRQRELLFSKIEQDLIEYKNLRIKELDKKINQLTIDTTKKIIGKSINNSQQEEIILNSLEEAKKINVF